MTSAPRRSVRKKTAGTPRSGQTEPTTRGAEKSKALERRRRDRRRRRARIGACLLPGLGDCILVRVKREDADDFKLMIDCGVVLGTEDARAKMTGVVENIVEDTNEKVDVLAITHEHWDHLSGFIKPPNSFSKLAAGSVWVAWTEDPDDKLANELRDELGQGRKGTCRVRRRAPSRRRRSNPRSACRHRAHPAGRRSVVQHEHKSGFRSREGEGQGQALPPDRPAVRVSLGPTRASMCSGRPTIRRSSARSILRQPVPRPTDWR